MKQRTANKLARLVEEMELLPDQKLFMQDNCNFCVIGHGINCGAINGFTEPDDEFNPAISFIFDGDFAAKKKYEDYLFESRYTVFREGSLLGLPYACDTAKDAAIRLRAVLDREGYDVEWV